MIRPVLLLLLTLFAFHPLQTQRKFFSLGSKNTGLAFGNAHRYNGIRLNAWDRDVGTVNGVNLAVSERSKKINGISLGILGCSDSIINGLQLGGLIASSRRLTGMTIAALFTGGGKCSGVVIAGLSPIADTLNGLSIGGWGVINWNRDKRINLINGLAASIMGNDAVTVRGLSVAAFNNSFDSVRGVSVAGINSTKQLHGVQIGLINYAGNNRKPFRWMPFFNFNFRRKNTAATVPPAPAADTSSTTVTSVKQPNS